MKKLLTGAAIAAALIAPSMASADTGSAGVHLGNLDSGSSDVDVYGLDLGYNHDFSNGWTLQGDATSERFESGGSSIGIGNLNISAGMRHDSHAIYGFVGHSSLLFADGVNVGVGGQIYLPNATLNGSVGYADFDGGNATNVHADGTYFFSDNFGLSGDLGYVDFDSSGSATIYGIGAVYRFAGSPVSLEGGYQVADFDGGDVDGIHIGLSINFGTETAREQSQSGASFNGGARLYHDFISGL